MVENLITNTQNFPTERSQRLCGLIAIETSGRTGSVAWCDPGHPPRLIELDPASRTTATLAPAIAELLATARAQHCRIDLVAVANGPGSFTGVRIGVTSAKMLAYALGCPLVAVDSLAAMAGAVFDAHPHCDSVAVAINAYRQQVFVADWTRSQLAEAVQHNSLETHSRVGMAAEWPAAVTSPVRHLWAAEPSIARKLTATPSSPLARVGTEVVATWPTALDVARLGRQLAEAGHFVSPMALRPNYLRDSAAEEKLR